MDEIEVDLYLVMDFGHKPLADGMRWAASPMDGMGDPSPERDRMEMDPHSVMSYGGEPPCGWNEVGLLTRGWKGGPLEQGDGGIT